MITVTVIHDAERAELRSRRKSYVKSIYAREFTVIRNYCFKMSSPESVTDTEPCLQAYKAYLRRTARGCVTRNDFIEAVKIYAQYGNAIPTRAILEAISARNQPVVELGSGLGYMAHHLAQKGVEITAVDIAPFSSSDNHRDQLRREADVIMQRPSLYYFVIAADAQEYLIEHEGCPGHTLLMMYPPTDLVSFVWRIDWKTDFAGNCIMFAISEKKFDELFVKILSDTNIWFESGSFNVPKYALATPGNTMKFRTFVRKEALC